MPANKKVEARVTPTVHAYLQDLIDTGAYGKTTADVARTLIEEGIRKALADRIIAVRRAEEEKLG